jgi:hypothetical protein
MLKLPTDNDRNRQPSLDLGKRQEEVPSAAVTQLCEGPYLAARVLLRLVVAVPRS